MSFARLARGPLVTLATLASLALLACHRDPTAPAGGLVASFGGPGGALVATPTSVRMETVCAAFSFPQPLLLQPNGEFALSPVLVPMRAGNRSAVALRGVVSGDHVEVDVRILTGAAETVSTHYSLVRGEPADFGFVACLAGA